MTTVMSIGAIDWLL